MKFKLTIVIIISVLMVAGGIVEGIYIKNTTDELVQRIDEILAEEPMDIRKIIDTGAWLENKHSRLEFIIPHFELNDLSVDYQEVLGAIERQDYDSAYITLFRIREYSKRLGDIYRFRVQNIV